MLEKLFFVAYSHSDTDVVEPIVTMLRTAGTTVFLDKDYTKPGDKWRQVLDQLLQKANVFLVFWSRHSATSEEVKTECESALGLGLRIVPVLLDNTPLEQALAEYQYIDFRPACCPIISNTGSSTPAQAFMVKLVALLR